MNHMKKNWKKKSLIALVVAVALMVGMFCIPAYAASYDTITAQLSPHYTIVVDGVERTFYNVEGEEVHPIVYQGTTYLPLRAIGELMDKNVNWDQSTKTATLSGSRGGSVTKGTPDRNAVKKNITATLRYDFTIVVDGEEQTFTDVNGKTVYPLLYNGSTYLPLRAIGNLMGKTVVWDGDTCTATLGDDDDLLVTDADSFVQSGSYISRDRAKEIALSHANLSASQVTFAYVALKSSGGQYVYEVEFYTSSKEYDYQINASTGKIVAYDYDAEHYTPTTPSDSFIGKAKAKEIALDHANLTASQVTFAYVELEYDNGRWEYEVEFYRNSTEYDYEIDASTGKILSYDYDAEHYTPGSQTGDLISESKAKSIALDHAGLTSSQVTFVRVKLDYDDGRWEYEVEFYRNNTEYDYEIDASTGKILSYDYDAEYYTPSSSGSFISETEAKNIALERAGVKENQVKSYKCELDEDDGRWQYEIEFRSGSYEYELEIDASTGAIRSYDKERD